MTISYSEPLRRAWARMKRMLFRPFRLENWLVLGFAAFLSELTSGGGGSGGQYRPTPGETPTAVLDRAGEFFRQPWVVALFIWLALAVVVFAIVATWVSARGKFIFVDNLVRERPGIVEPWRRFKRHGNSFFLWWVAFLFVVVGLAVLASAPIWPILRTAGEGAGIDSALSPWLLFAALEAPIVIGAITLGVFAGCFVVPIMYRQDIGVLAAWGRFFHLFGQHPGAFVLFLFSLVGLFIVMLFAILLVGLATCCIGLILMAIPYVGSVVLLPALITLRGYSLEFLAQFGDEYSVFSAAPPVIPAA